MIYLFQIILGFALITSGVIFYLKSITVIEWQSQTNTEIRDLKGNIVGLSNGNFDFDHYEIVAKDNK